jgi:hypothetical protein
MRHVIPGTILILLLRVADAAPPPHGDPTLAPWYNSLRMPDSTVLCCSMSDCRPVLSRMVDGHYQAFIADQWRDVPDDRVLSRPDNPTGHAVACWTPFAGVICFIKAPES